MKLLPTLARTRTLLLVVLCALCTACASYNDKIGPLVGRYASGDLQGAAEEVRSGALDEDFEDETDGILFLLEGAKILQDAGAYDESGALFDRASARLEHYDMVADVSVSEEFVAALGTQSSRTYRGTAYDRILVEVYQTFNELGRGDLSEALVRTRRAYRRQAEAVARNQDEIAAREEDANATGQAAIDSPEYGQFKGQIASLTSEAYADFVNPMASFLSAILLREEGSASNSLVDLRKLIGLVPHNDYLPALLEEFEASDSPTPERIYIIFENGLAPARVEWALTLPTPNGMSRFAMPTLQAQPTSVSHLRVKSADEDLATQQVASIDSIVAADFQANLASMVWRIVISQVAKETGAYAINHNNRNNDLAWIATSIYKVATSGADLRTWRTLGSEFQIAYTQRPADGMLELSYGNGAQAAVSVQIPSARTTFVLVRNPGFSPIVPHVFSIGAAPAEHREPTPSEPTP